MVSIIGAISKVIYSPWSRPFYQGSPIAKPPLFKGGIQRLQRPMGSMLGGPQRLEGGSLGLPWTPPRTRSGRGVFHYYPGFQTLLVTLW